MDIAADAIEWRLRRLELAARGHPSLSSRRANVEHTTTKPLAREPDTLSEAACEASAILRRVLGGGEQGAQRLRTLELLRVVYDMQDPVGDSDIRVRSVSDTNPSPADKLLQATCETLEAMPELEHGNDVRKQIQERLHVLDNHAWKEGGEVEKICSEETWKALWELEKQMERLEEDCLKESEQVDELLIRYHAAIESINERTEGLAGSIRARKGTVG